MNQRDKSYSMISKTLYTHPEYGKGKSFNFDIALIELPEEIQFNDNIKPVSLAPRYMTEEYLDREICSTCGFGVYKENGQYSTPH